MCISCAGRTRETLSSEGTASTFFSFSRCVGTIRERTVPLSAGSAQNLQHPFQIGTVAEAIGLGSNGSISSPGEDAASASPKDAFGDSGGIPPNSADKLEPEGSG